MSSASVFKVLSLEIITLSRETMIDPVCIMLPGNVSGNEEGTHKHKQLKETTTTKKIPLFLSYKTCSLVGKSHE